MPQAHRQPAHGASSAQLGERTTFTLRYRNFGLLIRCINQKVSDFNAVDEFRVTPPINH
jgi:hypothetical protein